MKSIIKLAFILVVFNVIFFSEMISAKNKKSKNLKTKNHKKQVHIVHDQNGFHSHLDHVVRRDPTVSVVTRLGAERLEPPSSVIYSSNSNTSNGPNIGFLGRSAELVGKLFFKFKFNSVIFII